MNRITQFILIAFCILKLSIHLIADSHSGFQGDELLHISTGRHLSLGYMEFPPLIGVLAFIQNLFQSQSVFFHHIFSHLASILILIFVTKTTVALGGKNKAVFFVLLGIMIAPGFGRSQQLFQPVVFSQLFWVLSFYSLVQFVKFLDKKSLWALTIFCTLGFLSKYDAVFFISGLFALLLFKRTRDSLIKNKFWWNILVANICILPNLLWQFSNDFPALKMFSRLYETQLNEISRIENMINLIIEINPINSLFLLLTGVCYLIISKNKYTILPLAITIFISFILLIYKNGKAYYFYPLILTIIPFGALFIEQFIIRFKKWMIYPITILMVLGGVLIPFGMPVYSLKHYLTEIYPYEKKEVKGGKYGVRFAEYYSQEMWKEVMQELKVVYDSLPANEKQNTLIWGKHYRQAGAVNLFGVNHNLPKAFSYHGSFYSWAPSGQMPITIISLRNSKLDGTGFFEPYFKEVIPVKTIYNPYAIEEDGLYQTIFICKNPKQDFDEMKELFKERIFE